MQTRVRKLTFPYLNLFLQIGQRPLDDESNSA